MMRNPPDMKVRLSADLRQKIEDAARQNNRTMNSEIVARLELSFRQHDPHSGASSTPPYGDHEERLHALEEIINQMMVDHAELSSRVVVVEARLNEPSS
jgi:hypothetical protein